MSGLKFRIRFASASLYARSSSAAVASGFLIASRNGAEQVR